MFRVGRLSIVNLIRLILSVCWMRRTKSGKSSRLPTWVHSDSERRLSSEWFHNDESLILKHSLCENTSSLKKIVIWGKARRLSLPFFYPPVFQQLPFSGNPFAQYNINKVLFCVKKYKSGMFLTRFFSFAPFVILKGNQIFAFSSTTNGESPRKSYFYGNPRTSCWKSAHKKINLRNFFGFGWGLSMRVRFNDSEKFRVARRFIIWFFRLSVSLPELAVHVNMIRFSGNFLLELTLNNNKNSFGFIQTLIIYSYDPLRYPISQYRFSIRVKIEIINYVTVKRREEKNLAPKI